MADEPNLAQEPHDPQVGDFLGHYRLVQLLGAGGMGVVFKAYEQALNRNVAVKVLSRRLSSDREFVHRFLNEAQAVASLNHTNITQIYYIAQQEHVLFFAMEFVDGLELETLMHRKKQLGVRETLDYIRQAAMGLNHAQKHSVIHRDIKPANLMVTREGIVKVCDFGLAKEVKAEHGVTTTQTVMGTPYYMSPEQTRGERVDFRSDIYSLGASMYQLLAGRPPFIADSAMAIMISHIQDPIPPIQQFNPNVPLAVNELISRAMAKSKDDRYQSYVEFIQDLEKLIATPLQVPATASPGLTTATILKPERSPAFTLGLIVIILALGILLVVSLNRPSPTLPLPVHGGDTNRVTTTNTTTNQRPLPVIPQPPPPRNFTAEAEKLLSQQQQEAQLLLQEKKYGGAIGKFTGWIKEYELTPSWDEMKKQRQAIFQAARTDWEKIKGEGAQKRLYDKYDEAVSLFDGFLPHVEGIDALTQEVTTERDATVKQQKELNAKIELARLNADQERKQKLEEVLGKLSQYIVKYQLDEAAKEAATDALSNTIPDLQVTLDSLKRDTEKLAALRKTFLSRMKAKPPKGTITLATRTNNESGEVVRLDENGIVLSEPLTDGGAVEVTLGWTRLATSEYLRLFYGYLDKQNVEELYSHAVFLFFLGLSDDAKANFQFVTNQDKSKANAAKFYTDRIATLQHAQMEGAAQRVWDRITTNLTLKKNDAVKRDLDLLKEQFGDTDFVKTAKRSEIEQMEVSLAGEAAVEIKRNQLTKRSMTWGHGKVLHVGSAPGQYATFEAALKEAAEIKDPSLLIVHEGQYDENISISEDLKTVEIAGTPGDMILVKSLTILSANTNVTLSGLIFAGHRPNNNQPINPPQPLTVQIGNFRSPGVGKGDIKMTDCAFLSDGFAVFRTGNLTIENSFFSTRYFDLSVLDRNTNSVRLNHNTYINSYQGRDFGRASDIASLVVWHNRNIQAQDPHTAYEITNNIFARPELGFRLLPQQSPQTNPKRYASDNNFFLPPRGFDLVIFNDVSALGVPVVTQNFPSLESWKKTGADGHSLSADAPGFEAPANDNFRLKADSPCLGKGSDNKNLGVVWEEYQWKAFDRAYHLLKTNAPKWTIPEPAPAERPLIR